MNELTVRIRGGGVICTPPSPTLLTTYVLLEQEQWFEKEVGFVRRVLRTGMRAIDVGANYGIYTLALARAVGSTGAVWSYEPSSSTMALLQRTVNLNELSQVTTRQRALSNQHGTARLSLQANSELNALTTDPAINPKRSH